MSLNLSSDLVLNGQRFRSPDGKQYLESSMVAPQASISYPVQLQTVMPAGVAGGGWQPLGNQVFACEYSCGFTSVSYQAVAEHERTCALHPTPQALLWMPARPHLGDQSAMDIEMNMQMTQPPNGESSFCFCSPCSFLRNICIAIMI